MKARFFRVGGKAFSGLWIVIGLIILIVGVTKSSTAQTSSLQIPSKKVVQLAKDTLIVDELVLGDSSVLELTHPNHYIKANRIIAGVGSKIIGIGSVGTSGKVGKSPTTPTGLCKAGTAGGQGSPGLDGAPGKDLTIDVVGLKIQGILGIDLHGGNGGDGGVGGKGGHGGSTTAHCTGDGGNGGIGGNGGNGGRGGNLLLSVQVQETVELVSKINLINRGGYRGLGGDGGSGGLRGRGPSEGKSKLGANGKPGVDGQHGKESKPLFYSIVKRNSDHPSETVANISGR